MPYIHIQPHSPQILGIKELLRNLAKPEQMLKYSFLLRSGLASHLNLPCTDEALLLDRQ